jgi:hypothetical protein
MLRMISEEGSVSRLQSGFDTRVDSEEELSVSVTSRSHHQVAPAYTHHTLHLESNERIEHYKYIYLERY